jgi:hypothetical protein
MQQLVFLILYLKEALGFRTLVHAGPGPHGYPHRVPAAVAYDLSQRCYGPPTHQTSSQLRLLSRTSSIGVAALGNL